MLPARFAGFLDGKLDTDELRKYITGGHVAEYMEEMKEEEPEKYKQHFSQYIKAGIKPDEYEDLVLETIEKIREVRARDFPSPIHCLTCFGEGRNWDCHTQSSGPLHQLHQGLD